MVRPDVVEILRKHQAAGDQVIVISASLEDWVRPWCKAHGINCVLGTQAKKQNGKLTGRFCTPNCYGQEKVTRLLKITPNRENYLLYAYGDSRGDRELLQFADFPHKV